MSAPRFLQDFAVGQKFGSSRLTVEPDAIRSFAAEFDPQPFHLDDGTARATRFKGLAASGWHTAALTMRLLVGSEFKPEGGVIGAHVELDWPLPVRPGDVLRVESEVLDVRPSRSRPAQGLLRLRTTTFNQNDEAVQTMVSLVVVPRRPPAR